MIARIWRGQATADNAPRYRDHATQRVFPSLASLPGIVEPICSHGKHRVRSNFSR